MMNNIKPLYLSVISGVLLILGWPTLPFAFLLFIALIPLLIIHEKYSNAKRKHLKFWAFSYLTFFIFNLGTTWWVWNASPSGSIIMLFANSLLMSLPFLLFSVLYNKNKQLGYWPIVVYFLTFEYIHFNWSASWPWLTLGKGLAMYPSFIQWYEITGEMGGSALILIVNIWIFNLVKVKKYIKLWQPFSAIFILFLYSQFLIFYQNTLITKSQIAQECIIVQPNIDPYKEKFSDGENYITPEKQLEIALDISKPLINSQTKLLLLPETAVTGNINESNLNTIDILTATKKLTDSNQLAIITGAETYNLYTEKERPTITARYDSFAAQWWDCYNTALLIKQNKVDSLYHKSKLVPGVEKMPFDFLEKLSINLGGASGSLGTSKKPINFIVNENLKIAPLVCYESVFGDYATEFVKDGANALAVITNDGWWGNTQGYKQHLYFGAIRCIETRKEMLRSANTGVSAKINMYGKITHQTQYNQRTAFRCWITPNTIETFYVKYGNWVGKIALILFSFTIVFYIFQFTKRK